VVPSGGGGTIALDAITTGVASTTVNSGTSVTTGTITVAAGATIAVCFCEESLDSALDSAITGEALTFAGATPTLLAGSKKHSGGDANTDGFGQLFTLLAPPTGSAKSATWAPTYTGGTLKLCDMLMAATFTGALAATPFVLCTPVNGNAVASLTLTATLATGDLLVGLCLNGAALPTVTTGTSIGSVTGSTNTGSHAGMRVATKAGAGSQSIVFGTGGADFSVATGIVLKAA
jgi:hypothetical protein